LTTSCPCIGLQSYLVDEGAQQAAAPGGVGHNRPAAAAGQAPDIHVYRLHASDLKRRAEELVLWLKAFHIIFVVTWFAGLFYLPRLFVYHAQTDDAAGRERFVTMERKLYAIMTLGGSLAVVFGVALLALNPSLLEFNWLRLKLAFVLGLAGFHFYCRRLMRELAEGQARAPVWYRWFNEIPAVALLAIVILVVVKPTL
jgi:putative membrane protein